MESESVRFWVRWCVDLVSSEPLPFSMPFFFFSSLLCCVVCAPERHKRVMVVVLFSGSMKGFWGDEDKDLIKMCEREVKRRNDKVVFFFQSF